MKNKKYIFFCLILQTWHIRIQLEYTRTKKTNKIVLTRSTIILKTNKDKNL